MYQLDWCGPHHAKRVKAFFDAKSVNVLPWPAQSLDSNPIENVLSIMIRHLPMLPKYPTTADKLSELLCDLWNELPDDYFKKLSDSMVRRVTP